MEIESSCIDVEGLDKIAGVTGARLQQRRAKVERVEASLEIGRITDTPDKIGKVVRATFTGTGSRNILLRARMDTL